MRTIELPELTNARDLQARYGVSCTWLERHIQVTAFHNRTSWACASVLLGTGIAPLRSRGKSIGAEHSPGACGARKASPGRAQ
jgi:hypothetical protein